MAKILRTTRQEEKHNTQISHLAQGEVDWLCLCDCGGGLVGPKTWRKATSDSDCVYLLISKATRRRRLPLLFLSLEVL